MANYLEDPAPDLRKWLWSELQLAGVLQANDYTLDGQFIVPIVPIQQQPEFLDRFSDKPFLTYDIVSEPIDPDLWYVSCDHVLFTVYSTNFSTSNRIRNLMIDLFRRQELAAAELNAFSASPVAYLSLSVIENRWTRPERSDTGRIAFDMVVRVKYVKQLESNGRFS